MSRGYNVFISYRRDSGEKDARIIQLALKNKGYSVFLDYDELIDGKFDHRIEDAIKQSSVFLLLLTEGALDNCIHEFDWVRQEIEWANKYSCYIIPVNIDYSFNNYPPNIPQELRSLFDKHQFSYLNTKALFYESFNKIVDERITPQIDNSFSENVGAKMCLSANADCILFLFGKKYLYLRADENYVVRFKPGNYKLEFISADDKVNTLVERINIPDNDYIGSIDVKMKEVLEDHRKKMLIAKRKANKAKWSELVKTEKNCLYGFKDKYTGEILIPCIWEDVGEFSDGFASVMDDNGKWGFIDKTGTVVIPCKWHEVRLFSEGLARVKDNNEKWGFIDKTGKLIIPCKWKEAWFFRENLALVMDDNGKWGIIDKLGKMITPCKWEEIWPFFDEGLVRVKDYNGRYGYIDKTGVLISPCKWKFTMSFSEKFAWVQDYKEKYGFIDKTGELVFPCKWKFAKDFNEGLALVMDDNGKCGFIDKTGKNIIPCKWQSAENFSEGLALVKEDKEKWGCIDKTGKVVTPCKWKKARILRSGLIRVKDNNGKMYRINKAGEIVYTYKMGDAAKD